MVSDSNVVHGNACAGARWGIPPFFVARGPHGRGSGAAFDFGAPTTARNALRVLRALQLRRAVLLEGSPGVGKTSLVAALARATGAPGALFGCLLGVCIVEGVLHMD